MKKLLALLLAIILILCPVLTSCTVTNSADADGKLTFYCVGEYGDELYEFIKKYNKYCAVNDFFEDSVEFVYFENSNEMNSVLATELMAGGGPDILSLTQTFPFEKLVRNNSLADINEILSANGSNLNFDDYNKLVMDSGVFDGKRYILPLYYRPNVLYTTEERLNKLGVDPDTADFNSITDELKNSNQDMYLINPYSSDSFYYSFIRQYIDFESGTTDFESEEFRTLAEEYKNLILKGGTYAELSQYEYNDSETHSDYLFSSNERSYYGGSLVEFAYTYLNASADGVTPRLYPNFSRSGEVTACIEVGFAINANCTKTDKAAKFIEYLLSESSQGYFSGARDDSSSTGLALPVKNSVFDNAVKEALDYQWYYWGQDELTEEDIEFIEQKNKALTEEYLPLIESITSCNLYGYVSQLESHLYQNVIGDIVNDYLGGKITTNKFVSRLTSAVKIYMYE